MNIKNIIIDCDGVLTDGKKYVDVDGERQMIAFHSRDNEAVRALQDLGFKVIIITASTFPGIRRYWMKRGVSVYSFRHKTKLEAEMDVDFSASIGVGDDLLDLPFLTKCAHAFVPADAHPELLRRFPALSLAGGRGVMAEVWHMVENGYTIQEPVTTIA